MMMWTLRDFVDPLRLAFRRLRREPLAWLSGVVTLGLGLGVNAALFAVVRSAWFSDLPVRAAHELALLRPRVTPPVGAPRENASWSYPMYEELRRSLATASGPPVEIAAFTPQARRVNFGAETADGHRARQLSVEMVSASYLRVLGVRPVIGRDFVAADDGPSGGQAVVLLSHRLWRREFAGDPGILGRSVAIERRPFEVIGVLPDGFGGLSEQAEAWVPMASAPALTFPRRLIGQLSFWHGVVMRSPEGRIEPRIDATLDPLLASGADAIAAAIPLREVFGEGRLSLRRVPVLEARRDPALGRTLALLCLVAAAVLAVAAINVGHLVLTRVSARSSELAMRQALGADRREAWGRNLADSIWLGIGGLAIGLTLVPAVLALVRRYRPSGTDTLLSDALTNPAAPLLAVAALTALVIAALTVLGTVGERTLLRGGGGGRFGAAGSAREAGGSRLRTGFVVTQLALVLVVALAAASASRGLQRIYHRPLGFDPSSTLTLRVALPRGAYLGAAELDFFSRTIQRLSALPGVEVASFANCLPLSDSCDHVRVRLEQDAADSVADAGNSESREAVLNMIDPNYLRTLGLPIVAGRGFTAADREGAPPVVLVDRTAARALWPGESALGQRLAVTVGFPEQGFAEVVGVVDDVPAADLLSPPTPTVYLSLAQFRYSAGFFALRFARGDDANEARVAGAAEAATRAIHAIDPDLAVFDVATLDESVHRSGASVRFGAVLLSVLGGLATALAGLGVYAVAAFAVGHRRRELAVRLAFGARPAQLEGDVLRMGLRLAGLGVSLGGGLALALDRLLVSRLEGAVPLDPQAFLVTAAWVSGLALLACWIPARRAAATDPATALRSD